MGLSASQARLLSLTARQSNLEYEGQQINQQRTSLSNESSNYYNSLLEMDVPVPPSSNDYTKIVYTFTIGGNKATVKEALPQKDVNTNTTYLITYTTELSTIGIKENDSYKTAASAKRTEGAVNATTDTSFVEDKKYYLATMNRLSNEEITELKNDGQSIYVKSDLSGAVKPDGNPNADAVIIGTDGYQVEYDTLKTIQNKIKDYEDPSKYTQPLSNDDAKNLEKLKKELSEFTVFIPDDGADATQQRYAVSYAQIANENTFDTYKTQNQIFEYDAAGTDKGFYSYKASNLNEYTVVDPQYTDSFLNAGLDVNDYYQYESTSGIRFVKREDVEGNLNNQSRTISTSAVSTIDVINENTISGATIEFDSSGRISTITDEEGITYTMTASTETDDAAYDDAYNQYEYNQYLYDQKQNEINANIEILQAQDKSLELRLSTLDTQHSAIQTELEAVKKVMSKNIESSFKTFNA